MPHSDPVAHRAYHAAYNRAWRLRNIDKRRAWDRAWYHQNKEKAKAVGRRCHLRRSYGISVEQYESLYLAQGERCAACRCLPKRRRLAVDHDHITGRVRGLLCPGCNVRVEAIERYLIRARSLCLEPK